MKEEGVVVLQHHGLLATSEIGLEEALYKALVIEEASEIAYRAAALDPEFSRLKEDFFEKTRENYRGLAAEKE